MLTKYVTRSYSSSEIKAVEVVRETEQSVYVISGRGGERRQAKLSSYHCYHDTWEAARDYLLTKAESEVALARRWLEVAQGALGNVKGLKKPA